MTTVHDCLFELGCEELPATELPKLERALSELLTDELNSLNLSFEKIKTFSTPRRLAVVINNLIDKQASQQIDRQGPSAKTAYDKNGMPTIACLSFAKACGVAVDQLKIKETAKGSWVSCSITEAGKKTKDCLPDIFNKILKRLPVKKSMRWGNSAKRFSRPVHWAVLLLGNDLINTEILGVKTSRETFGHRFHHPKAITITKPTQYEQLLMASGHVIPDANRRKELIEKGIKEHSKTVGMPLIDKKLLNEVTNMVEWPVVLRGQFNPEFLKVPAEALMMSMMKHQKCFPIAATENNKLAPYFILVSNIDSKDPKAIIKGNERVIHARLSDAAFFYHNDLQHPLEEKIKLLGHVIFQKQLGSLADKTKRVAKLAGYIASKLNIEKSTAERAAQLCKCDLLTEMVGEFPELQGTMGYYYALQAKEPKAIATAVRDYYLPRFSKDKLPSDKLSAALAIADRLDTLVGFIGMGILPKGDKDPFALRRAALGIIRILIENKLDLDLADLIKQTHTIYHGALSNNDVLEQGFDFMMDRLRAWYLDQKINSDIFAAVMACRPTAPLDFDHRIKAVIQFNDLPEATALASANKRVSNILKKQGEKKLPSKINNGLFESDAEKKLNDLLSKKSEAIDALYQKSDYTKALSHLATFKDPVDTFFNDVMIMVEDKKVRDNRLALLVSLRRLFTQVADISLLP